MSKVDLQKVQAWRAGLPKVGGTLDGGLVVSVLVYLTKPMRAKVQTRTLDKDGNPSFVTKMMPCPVESLDDGEGDTPSQAQLGRDKGEDGKTTTKAKAGAKATKPAD